MDCSFLVDNMVWSYSRIVAFEDCPYRFLLTYILKIPRIRHKFFSDYGTFVHHIIQKYLTGELKKEELAGYYLSHFYEYVIGKSPDMKIFSKYFSQGLQYFKNVRITDEKILGVEQEFRFDIGNKNFVGYIDKLYEDDDGLVIADNKSRILEPRSGKCKPTKNDKELDKYLRQLYLYSEAVRQKYGIFPYRLEFNCFRSGTTVSEKFDEHAFAETKKWTTDMIKGISNETEWAPKIDWFGCKYLCDQSDNCEYFQMYER